MSLEGFVRAVGAAMGAASDAFGTGDATEVAPTASAPAIPGSPVPGTGQALEALDAESVRLKGHAAALGEQDGGARAQFAHAVAAATSARARINSIIGSAIADVHALSPAAATPHGQQALVKALTRRLMATQQELQNGHADAVTRAAGSQGTAADYQSTAQLSPSGRPGPVSPVSGVSMGAMPLAGLGGLGSLMSAQPGELGRGAARGRQGANGRAATDSITVEAVVSRALSQHGTPYSRGGGGKTGPGRGDDGKVGFDCSSLMQYAFAAAGVDLPRTTYEQVVLGRRVAPTEIRAGDLIFSNFGERGNSGPRHVQLAISSTHVVEAPQTGEDVRISALPAGHIVVRRILT